MIGFPKMDAELYGPKKYYVKSRFPPAASMAKKKRKPCPSLSAMTYCSPLFGKRRFIKRCPPFIGIDDFAFRKGHSYGTIICDLSTHKPVALLPERYPETISEWLKNHQNIQVVSRDGYQAFRKGIQNASQSILQVYDR